MEKNNIKVNICCVAKDEELTICDWIDYHKNIGINHISIFDNNDVNNDSLSTLLSEYIKNGFVDIDETYKSYIPKSNEHFQETLYTKFLNEHYNKNEYDWIGFIDCDEYITFENNINDYFLNVPDNINCILVNWELYGDNDKIHYENKPVIERFTKLSKFNVFNCWCKSFIRNNVNGNFYGGSSHLVTIDFGKYCDCNYNIVDASMKLNSYMLINKKIKLRHYITKSLEEYVKRKLSKNGLDSRSVYTMKDYWLHNDKTNEKLQFIAKNGINIT